MSGPRWVVRKESESVLEVGGAFARVWRESGLWRWSVTSDEVRRNGMIWVRTSTPDGHQKCADALRAAERVMLEIGALTAHDLAGLENER